MLKDIRVDRRALFGAAGAALLAVGLIGPAAAQTELKWAHVYETSEPYHTWAVWAAEQFAERTDGRYTIEVFPASSLGKETDINEGLGLGTVDIIYTGQLFAGPLPRRGRHRRGALHVPRLRSLGGSATATCSRSWPRATSRRAATTSCR
jgi:hypothetical protein